MEWSGRRSGAGTGVSISRRGVLGLGLGIAAIALPARAASAPRRVASLDYALAETLLLLGVPPVAVAEAGDWGTWVVEPPLPPGVIDIGSAQDPNLERLVAVAPDLILTTDYVAMLEPVLARIAPVRRLTIYGSGVEPLPRARQVTLELGRLLDREGQARDAVAGVDAAIAKLAGSLDASRIGPLLLVSFMDARHVRVYGRASLYGNAMSALGLQNGWQAEVNYWGFATVGIEALAGAAGARLIAVDPVPPDVWPVLARSPLWTGLPFVEAGRVSTVAPALMFGALPSALRFAQIMHASLLDTAS